MFGMFWLSVVFSVQNRWVFELALFSLWLASSAMAFALCSVEAGINYCLATKHQLNSDLHQANLLNVSDECTQQWFGFKIVFKAIHSPLYSMLVQRLEKIR